MISKTIFCKQEVKKMATHASADEFGTFLVLSIVGQNAKKMSIFHHLLLPRSSSKSGFSPRNLFKTTTYYILYSKFNESSKRKLL
jgi:hypothetical protein